MNQSDNITVKFPTKYSISADYDYTRSHNGRLLDGYHRTALLGTGSFNYIRLS